MNAKEIEDIKLKWQIHNRDNGLSWNEVAELVNELSAKSKEGELNEEELDELSEAYSKGILPHEKKGSLPRMQLEVGFVDGYRASFGKEGEG